jgi:hypothetical protein
VNLQGRSHTAALGLVYAALSLYFTLPLLLSGANLGIGDWDAMLFQHAAVIRSVFAYGEAPFWNPWYCGGNVLWQNPQAPLISPVYVLAPFMPLAVAMKIVVVAHYLVGFAGMHMLLTRALRITWLPALLFLCSLFVLAGGPALHLVVGHTTFLPYFYLPWLLLLWIRAIETGSPAAVAGAAAILAVSMYGGGIYMTFMAGVGLACFSAAAALCLRQWRPIAVLASAGVLAALLAAPKLVPMLAYLGDARLVDLRHFHRPDRMTLELVVHAFADPFQYPRMLLRDQMYGWHEYGNYLGFLGAPLIGAAFLWMLAQRPKARAHWLGLSLAVTAALLFGLMLGESGRFAPYELLSRLPMLEQFRLPSRYTLLFVLFATCLTAWVMCEAVGEDTLNPRMRRLAGMVLLLGAASLAYQNRVHFGGAFPLAPLAGQFSLLSRPPAPAIDDHTQGMADDSPMLRAMMDNRAVLSCYEPLVLPGAVDPARPIIVSDEVSRVSDITFTPNRITFDVQTGSRPARLLFNTKYLDGWRASVGTLELDPGTGLAQVVLPPGTSRRVELRFVPPGLTAGVALGGLGLLACGAAWYRRRPGVPKAAHRRSGNGSD